MPNEIDDAQTCNEDFQAYVLDQHQRNREPANYTGTDCLDCSDEIPKERRQAQPGCRRCITCQEAHEIHNRRRAL